MKAKTYQNVSQTDVRNRRSEQPNKKEIPFFELRKMQWAYADAILCKSDVEKHLLN